MSISNIIDRVVGKPLSRKEFEEELGKFNVAFVFNSNPSAVTAKQLLVLASYEDSDFNFIFNKLWGLHYEDPLPEHMTQADVVRHIYD